MEWIKQGFEKVVPQPGHSPSVTDTSDKKEPATDPAPQPPKGRKYSQMSCFFLYLKVLICSWKWMSYALGRYLLHEVIVKIYFFPDV